MIENYIESAEKMVDDLERDLYDDVMAVVVGLVFSGGKAVWNVQNISVVGKVDSALRGFGDGYIAGFKNELAGLNAYYVDYMRGIGVESESLKGFDAIMGGMNNYLDDVGLLSPVKQRIKDYLLGAISNGQSMGTIRAGLREMMGLEDLSGVLKRYYNQYLFDVVMRFDRIIFNRFAEQNGLEYFIYSGGLISESREFCTKRDGLVFHKDDAEEWKTDTSLPGYPSVDGYVPLVDFGRWNCRHYALWITKQQADEKRNG